MNIDDSNTYQGYRGDTQLLAPNSVSNTGLGILWILSMIVHNHTAQV